MNEGKSLHRGTPVIVYLELLQSATLRSVGSNFSPVFHCWLYSIEGRGETTDIAFSAILIMTPDRDAG